MCCIGLYCLISEYQDAYLHSTYCSMCIGGVCSMSFNIHIDVGKFGPCLQLHVHTSCIVDTLPSS